MFFDFSGRIARRHAAGQSGEAPLSKYHHGDTGGTEKEKLCGVLNSLIRPRIGYALDAFHFYGTGGLVIGSLIDEVRTVDGSTFGNPPETSRANKRPSMAG